MSEASHRVLSRLHAVAAAMRRRGAAPAPQELADAARSAALLGADAFTDPGALSAVLSATLAKSARDEAILAEVLPLVFSFSFGGAPLVPFINLLARRGIPAARAQELLDALCAEVPELQEPDNDSALAAVLAGDDERLTEAMHRALENVDLGGLTTALQVNYYAGRVLGVLGAEALAGVGMAAVVSTEAQALAGALAEAGEQLRRAARRAVERELALRSAPPRGGDLLDRDLVALGPADAQTLRAAVWELARRIRSRIAQRRRRTRRGRLDARRTLRESAGTDGMLVRPRMKRRRPERPDLVVLCDVSDSVRAASLFMLELVAALSDALPRTRSFVFVDELVDVTRLFVTHPERAASEVLQGGLINLSANSDYGRALRTLWSDHRAALGRRTTVVILGDGQSNYRAPEAHILGWVKQRVRRVVWLSPEERATWGFGDSEMTRFARHADAIPGQRSPRDLAAAIDRIAR